MIEKVSASSHFLIPISPRSSAHQIVHLAWKLGRFQADINQGVNAHASISIGLML
jgi:hypothetical protein